MFQIMGNPSLVISFLNRARPDYQMHADPVSGLLIFFQDIGESVFKSTHNKGGIMAEKVRRVFYFTGGFKG
jgi:hypothetical protein